MGNAQSIERLRIPEDINEANTASNHKKVSVDKRYLFKGWRLVIA